MAPYQDGKVTFTMSGANAAWFGLSKSENINSASDFDYGFYSWTAYVWNILHGQQGAWHIQFAWNRYFHFGDVAAIERVGNQMIYTYDGIEIARTTVDPSEKLFVASLTQIASGQIFRALCDFGEGKFSKSFTNVSCDANNGQAEVNYSDDAQGKVYTWQPEPWSGQSTNRALGLAQGEWCVYVHDTIANSHDTICFTIGSAAPLNSNVIATSTCSTCSTASITIAASGGLTPYKYSIDGGNTISTNNVFSNLQVGMYSVATIDAANCRKDTTIIISGDTIALSAVVAANKNWLYPASGAIDLTITGGVPPYTVVWNNESETEDLTELVAGAYSVIVSDGLQNVAGLNVQVYNEVQWDEFSGVIVDTNNVLTKIADDGWDDGAATSVAQLGADYDGDASIKIVDPTSTWKAGFASSSASVLDDIDYGFYSDNGTLKIIEQGQSQGSYGALAAGDQLNILKSDGSIIYFKNNVELKITTPSVALGDIVFKVNLKYNGVILNPKVGVSFGTQKSIGVYAQLKRKPDGTYVKVIDETLRFIYKEEYDVTHNLTYKIFDASNNVVLDGTKYAIRIKKGINKIEISCLNQKVGGSKFYLMEITNDKNEKWYLRFSDESLSPCQTPVKIGTGGGYN